MASAVDTFGIHMDMRDLDDVLLQKTIDNQEAMIAQTPSMRPMIMPALLQYIAERDRRQKEEIDTIVANVECYSDEENRAPTHGRANNATVYETPDKKPVIATLDKTPAALSTSGRSKRVRQMTDHFSTESKLLAFQADKRRKSERSVLLGRMRKHPEFSATIRAQQAALMQTARSSPARSSSLTRSPRAPTGTIAGEFDADADEDGGSGRRWPSVRLGASQAIHPRAHRRAADFANHQAANERPGALCGGGHKPVREQGLCGIRLGQGLQVRNADLATHPEHS